MASPLSPAPAEDLATLERRLESFGCRLEVDPGPRFPELDPADYLDDEVTTDTNVIVGFPNSQESLRTTLGQLQALLSEIDSAKLDHLTYVSFRRALLPVEYPPMAKPLRDGFEPWPYVWHSKTVSGRAGPIEVGVVQGASPYSLLMAKLNRVADFCPAAAESDLFIEATFAHPDDVDQARELLDGYVFEFNQCLPVRLRIHSRWLAYFNSSDDAASSLEGDESDDEANVQMRELVHGRGVGPLLHLYNSADMAEDPEIQVLMYYKVLEYISPTVLRKSALMQVRARLMTPQALDPSPEYVFELIDLIEQHREFRKDATAIRLTVVECCDAMTLKDEATSGMERLRTYKSAAKESDRVAALEQFADCVTATRNAIVHAKTNYHPTGNEVRSGEYPALARALRSAGAQALRWYAASAGHIRVAPKP